ncbi:Uncharacterized protein APZ42_014103, partial [Daphnia magna]
FLRYIFQLCLFIFILIRLAIVCPVGRNGRAMSYGTIQPYLDSRKHLKLQTGHTVTVIALHGQRIQISCSVINLTSSGSYLEFREKDGDIAKQPVINRVYTSKSNTMAVYSQIVKDADWFNCKWKTTDSYPIHKLCRDIEAKTINGAIQSMDLAEESHRFCTFSIVVPLDQHVQISCSVVSLASGCGLKFHEERGWMNEAGLISTRPIIDRNYTSKGNKMFIQADSFDNKRCRFDCTWKTTTTPTYRLSLNNVSKLVQAASKSSPEAKSSPCVKYGQMWQIRQCEALKAQSEKWSDLLPELTNKMLLLMGLNPLVVKVKTILRDFFICGTDGLAKFCFEEENGMIHEEGRIKVELNEKIQLFNVCEDSDRHYHVTAFYSDCDHQLEKVTFGWRLAMVFDLVFEEKMVHNPLCPPANLHSFLAVGHIQETLAQWATNENDYPSMLALVLDHRYSSTQLNFHSLKGRDHLLTGLLRSVDSINTYLSHFQAHERSITLSDQEDSENTDSDCTITLSDQEDSENTDSDCTNSICICCVTKGCSCQKRVRRRAESQPNLRNGVKILSLTGVDGKTMECIPIDVDLDSEMILFNQNVHNIRPNVTVFDCDNMEYDIPDGHTELGLLRWLRE